MLTAVKFYYCYHVTEHTENPCMNVTLKQAVKKPELNPVHH